MKKIALILVMVGVVASLAIAETSAAKVFPWEGCFTKADGSPYEVVFITDQAANEMMVAHTKHDQGVIEKGGGRWTLFSANMDVAKQSSALEDTLLRKPDAIVLHPVAADTTIPYIERGTDKGIDFYVSMMPPLTEKGRLHPDILAYVGDYQKSSIIARANYMIDYFKKKGIKARLLFAWGSYGKGSFCAPVWEALQKTIKGSPWVEKVYETPGTNFMVEKLYNATMDAFAAHPDINAILPCCGMGQQGIYQALQDVHRWYPEGHKDHVFIATRDAEDWALEYLEQGYINSDCDMHIDRYSDTTAKVIWWLTVKGAPIKKVNTSKAWSYGQGIPEEILMHDTLVTKETVQGMREYWKKMGRDYYNWPCHKDEEFIKYPAP